MSRPTPNSTAVFPAVQVPCGLSFGAAATAVRWTAHEASVQVSLPVLGGAGFHALLPAGLPEGRDGCTLCRQGGRMAGFMVAPPELDPEAAGSELYRRLLAATADLFLYRIWNFVPRINAVAGELENYRRFCRGRSLAFEAHLGPGFQRQLPAASAVGTPSGPLALAFLAGDHPARHFENPKQIPAFEYPSLYGPRPPSFSRATLVTRDSDRQLFISGTAAIRGHLTISPTDLAGQLACTHENLQLIAETAGAGTNLGANEGWQRRFTAYVRRDHEFAPVKTYLERHVLRPGDEITYLQADLCRTDLRVEIETILSRPA